MAMLALDKLFASHHTSAEVRAAAVLTNSYVASSHIDATRFDWLNVLLDYTHSAATSIEWYVEWSFDQVTWFRSLNVAPSAGVNTITANSQTFASATAKLSDGAIRIEAPYVRVQAKCTGTVTSSSLTITLGMMRKRV